MGKVLCLVVVLCLFAAGISVAASDTLSKDKKIDLNGDGKLDHVWLENIGENDDYILHINDAQIKGTLHAQVEGFYIRDFDNKDKYKEVDVYTSLPSDDHRRNVYYYDGKQIQLMAYFDGQLDVTGYGIVYLRTWNDFWVRVDKYVLDSKSRKFDLVPQDFYYVGVEGNVRKSIPIYKTISSKEEVANLRENSTVLVVINKGDWYLVKSTTGLVGWVNGDVLLDNVTLPTAD